LRRPIDAFVIGAQKGGTTTVYDVLGAHRDVRSSWAKENHYFTRDEFWESGPRYLDAFYPEPLDEALVLGAYANTMMFPGAVDRLAAHNPGMHIIACLRDPVERAWSAFWFARRNGWEPVDDFEQALALEAERRTRGGEAFKELTYAEHGRYASQLRPYFERFGADRVHVVFQEELCEAPEAVFGGLCDDLGLVRDDRLPMRAVRNPAGTPRSPLLHRTLLREAPWKAWGRRLVPAGLRACAQRYLVGPVLTANLTTRANPPMPWHVRERLRRRFEGEDWALARLIGRPVPWRASESAPQSSRVDRAATSGRRSAAG
jgi:hypothetical protein